MFSGEGLEERYSKEDPGEEKTSADTTPINAVDHLMIPDNFEMDFQNPWADLTVPMVFNPQEYVPEITTFEFDGNKYEINAISLDHYDAIASDPEFHSSPHTIDVGAMDEETEEQEDDGTDQQEDDGIDQPETPNGLRDWLDDDGVREDQLEVEGSSHDELDVSITRDTILSQLQEEDDELCAPLLKVIRGGDLPQSDENPIDRMVRRYHRMYSLDDKGRLIYRKTQKSPPRLVVPSALRKQLLWEHHNSPSGGHFGRNKTYARMLERYWWPGMHTDVEDWLALCSLCGRRKPSPFGKVGHLYPLNCKEPFGMLGIDLMGPLPETKEINSSQRDTTDRSQQIRTSRPVSDMPSFNLNFRDAQGDDT
jgi:hypothetical protein